MFGFVIGFWKPFSLLVVLAFGFIIARYKTHQTSGTDWVPAFQRVTITLPFLYIAFYLLACLIQLTSFFGPVATMCMWAVSYTHLTLPTTPYV